MSDFETDTCKACGEDFEAHPDSNAAETGYCSPACENAV